MAETSAGIFHRKFKLLIVFLVTVNLCSLIIAIYLGQKLLASLEASNQQSHKVFSQLQPLRQQFTEQQRLFQIYSEQPNNQLHLQKFVDSQQQTSQTLAELTSDFQFNGGSTETRSTEVVDLYLFGTVMGVYLLTAMGLAVLMIVSSLRLRNSAKLNNSLALIPETSPHPMMTLNQHDQITYCNAATHRLVEKMHLSLVDLAAGLTTAVAMQKTSGPERRDIPQRIEYQIGDLVYEGEIYQHKPHQQWHVQLIDITARKLAEQRLYIRAYHHPETCLENQYRFNEVIEQLCFESRPFCLGQAEIRSYSQLLADKSTNGSHQIVTGLAAVLHKSCHDIDTEISLFQIGDKDFAIVIPGQNCNLLVARLVGHINKELKQTPFSGRYHVELDFGFACYPKDATKDNELLRNTRIALDASASKPHSDFAMFSKAMAAKIQHQHSLQIAMREALATKQFQLYFQPQLCIQRGKVTGAEVLIRWFKNDKWITPTEFIPLAESSGLILQLGDWILDTACEKASQIIKMGHSDLVIAVNISPKQFTAPDFVDNLKIKITKYDLAAQNLELEITEGLLFNNDPATLTTLHQIRNMGVKLTIDDFGTGYSSLSYLKDFPIDKLKIDQSFIRNMQNDHADESIVRTIIDLGRNLNLTLIAEGVENDAQAAKLKAMACHEIQGDWFSKPLDEGYFIYFLQTRKNGRPGAGPSTIQVSPFE